MLCHAHCEEYAEWSKKQRERSRRPTADVMAASFEIERGDRIRRARQQRFDDRNRKRG